MTADPTDEIDTPMLDELFSPDETDTLSDSDEVYLSFRQVVDPGLMAANFDLTPGKSAAFTSRMSGERFTDQPLRSHILNGAAFGARLNTALRALNSEAALTDEQLLEVLAMFACHDLHKSETAQRRRANDHATQETEYHIPDEEIEYYVDKLRLNDLVTAVEANDYKASALRAEEQNGLHCAVSSTRFTLYSDWLRLLDAAAALSAPDNINTLTTRLTAVAPDVQLDYHRIDDIKGITTNLLNSAIADYINTETTAEPVVYFHDGVVYLTPTETDIHGTLTNTSSRELMREMSDHYVTQLHNEVDSFADTEQIKNALAGNWANGYISVGKSAYLLYGFEHTENAIRELLTDKANTDQWTLYSAYKKGTITTLENGFIDTLPDTHHKTQALAMYLGSLETELFRRLRYDDTIGPVNDIVNTLDLPEISTYIDSITDAGTWSDCTPTLSETNFDKLANHLGVTKNNLTGIIEDGYNLTDAKAWSHVVAHAYLNSTREDGTQRAELPIETILEDTSNAILDAFSSWNTEWDDTIRGDWDASLSADKKVARFKKRLLGPFYPSTRDYIARFVSVNGKQLADAETNKTKLNEAQKDTQAHICGLCRDLLIGGTSLERDFRTSQKVVGVSLGFTHRQGITAHKSEPKPVVCAQCDLETTLRNSIHSLDEDDSHNYLYVAPDYYYSPADMAIQARIRRQFKADSGFTLLQLAKEIVSGNPNNRADSIERVLEVFKTNDDYRDYNEFIHNYDNAISNVNSMGVYRLDPAKDSNNTDVSRIARWLLDTMFAVVVSWATSSRVLLTPSPLPTTNFNDFPQMVKLENAPGPVTDFIGGNTISISRRRDLELAPTEYRFENLTAPSAQNQSVSTPAVSRDPDEMGDSVVPATDGGSQTRLVQLLASTNPNQPSFEDKTTFTLDTELGTTLYKLSALLYISYRRFGVDVGKLTTTLDKTRRPFPAASMMLKGNGKTIDYSALSAASILDTLTNYTMSDRIQQLAEAGFETLRPRNGTNSNYEYERLFRVATETVMDMDTASPEELKTIVTGEVMNTASRTGSNEQYSNQEYTREPAEDFAEIFIEEIFIGLCNSNPFELNQKQNTLASGYNAAIRRHEKAWLTTKNN